MGGAGGGGGTAAGGAGEFARRQRARARRSVFSFLRCFFTKVRRAFAERCERKNARLRDAIFRSNGFSRFVSALHGFAWAATAQSRTRVRDCRRGERDEEGKPRGRERRFHVATLSGP